jgi:hypothetical protein
MEKCEKKSNEVPLKEYLLDKILSLEKLTDERFKTSQLAITKSEESLKEYKAQANEWRGQSKDQALTYATKAEVERNTDDIKSLRESRSEGAGKNMGTREFLGYILAGIAIIGFFISYFILK